MKDWNAQQYLKFKDQRTQPAIDLVHRIYHPSAKDILDVGSGPGNSTQVLYEAFPHAQITGIDSSVDMINTSVRSYPHLNFKHLDAVVAISTLQSQFDIIFSNACIQWIPEHQMLINGLFGLLKKNGQLAIQIPYNFDEPIHQLIQEVTTHAKWSSYFSNQRIFHSLTLEAYYDCLSQLTSDFSIWQTSYYHPLDNHESMLEWYKGTGLKPYLDQLPDTYKSSFEKDILMQMQKHYPLQNNGKVLFKFPRLFFTAIK